MVSNLKKEERALRKEWKEIVRQHGGPPRPWTIVLEELYPPNWGERAVRRSLRHEGTSVTAKIVKLTPKKMKTETPKKHQTIAAERIHAPQ